MNYLLYDDESPRAVVEALASKLGYDTRTPRAPVLFRLRVGLDAAQTLAAFKKGSAHEGSDLSWATPDGAVLVFKTLVLGKAGIIADYEAGIDTYIRSAESALGVRSGGPAPFRAFAGALQTDLARYKGSWRQVLWLEDRASADDERVVFFYRRLGEWLASRAPRNEMVDAFESVAGLLSDGFAEELVQSVRALTESSFNGKEAAARLGIHRNTLAARLARFQAVFGIDPRNDGRSRDFLSVLSAYLDLRGRDPGR
jgi:sugar diacid utilization regulator